MLHESENKKIIKYKPTKTKSTVRIFSNIASNCHTGWHFSYKVARDRDIEAFSWEKLYHLRQNTYLKDVVDSWLAFAIASIFVIIMNNKNRSNTLLAAQIYQ